MDKDDNSHVRVVGLDLREQRVRSGLQISGTDVRFLGVRVKPLLIE